MAAVYVSASTNRYSQAADCSPASEVAFGSRDAICLWDTNNDQGICGILPGHGGLVTCIRFSREDLFFSVDDKGSLRRWRKQGNEWSCGVSVQAHLEPVSALAVYEDRIVTGSSDGQAKVWDGSDDVKHVQTITLQRTYPLSLALTRLPDSQALILAIGTTDWTVQIWTRSDDLFVCATVLAGHDDWVRSLAFRNPLARGDPLVLASGSQDSTIRLWNIDAFVKETSKYCNQTEDTLSDELLDSFEASLGDLSGAEESGRQISLKQHIVTVKSSHDSSQKFAIIFDALLIGHEAGVTSLSWRSYSRDSIPMLLSTSTDSSVILWSPSTMSTYSHDESASLWINQQRFGDIGGQRLGGFIGGLWAHHGTEVLAWGWSGGWRRWSCSNSEADWVENGAVGGHSAPVRGISWSPGGEYLISAGMDQTTRIHGPTPLQNADPNVEVWSELARPQVHGYDLVDCAFLDALTFVSIADEKVVRVFEAPSSFVRLVRVLGVADLPEDERPRPIGASVPPLGLSNKAFVSGDQTNPQPSISPADASTTVRRPFESELASMTLWPEVEKIFGHGYESISLAVSSSRTMIATACKATTPEHAVVRVYNTADWQRFGEPLPGHSLTVTRIAFSPDDQLVLSVSRDRSWRLFERREQTGYVAIAGDKKAHARIIWDCAWAAEGDIFATASRDKMVRVWQRDDPAVVSKWSAIATIRMEHAATAVNFLAAGQDDRRRMAVGLETGSILVYASPRASPSAWSLVTEFDSRRGHAGQVHRLAWRPWNQTDPAAYLASCSEDGKVKVMKIDM